MVMAGVRVRIRDRVMNRNRGRVKLMNYSLITGLLVATSADPLIRFLLLLRVKVQTSIS